MRGQFQKLLYVLAFVGVVILHLTYIPNGFTWLDHGDIESKRAIVSLNQMPYMFVNPFGQTGFYRPLVTLTHSVDYMSYGTFAPGYHLTNVLLHIAVVLAALLFLSVFFTFSSFELLIVILIIGLHPLGWLPVGSISYRPELLVTFFILLTVYLHAQARLTSSPQFAVLAVVSFFLGLLAKETALVLIPLLIVVWEVSRKRLLDKKQTKNSHLQLLFIPEVLIIGLYAYLRMLAVPQLWNVQQYALSFEEAIGTRLYAVVKLLGHFINPLRPPLSDTITIVGLMHIYTVIFLLLAGVGCLIIIRLGRYASWTKALVLFTVMLLPAFAIIPVPRLGSPHYGYIPLAAFAAITVLLLRGIHKRRIIKKTAYVLLFLWLVTAAYTTAVSGAHFKNDLTLFGPEVAKDTQFYEGHFYLGNFYFTQKDYARAEVSYKNALVKNTQVIAYHQRTAAYINLANLKYEQGKTEEAVVLLEDALRYGDPAYRENINKLLKYIKSKSTY